MFLDLSGRRLRQLLKVHAIRRIEVGQPLPYKLDQFLLAQIGPLRRHERHGPFAPMLVRHRDDSHLENIRVGREYLLDFDRGDVLATADNEVLAAIG